MDYFTNYITFNKILRFSYAYVERTNFWRGLYLKLSNMLNKNSMVWTIL